MNLHQLVKTWCPTFTNAAQDSDIKGASLRKKMALKKAIRCIIRKQVVLE